MAKAGREAPTVGGEALHRALDELGRTPVENRDTAHTLREAVQETGCSFR